MQNFKITLVILPKTGRSFEVDLTDGDWMPENGDFVETHGVSAKVTHTLFKVDESAVVVTAKEE